MSRLMVEAFSEDTIAAPGNREPNYLVVSVSDTNGLPVADLDVSNFKVDPMVVGPGGSLVNISSLRAGRLPGFYFIKLVPIGTGVWKAGVYIFAISVTNGSNSGQTLAKVHMD